eukprot:jgi/Mesvir1/22225/Mv14919-RA.3
MLAEAGDPCEKDIIRKEIAAVKQGILKQRRRLLSKARVLGVTTASAGRDVLDGQKFRICVLDECSQMTEPHSLMAISRFGCERPLFVRLCALEHTPILLSTQYRLHPRLNEVPNQLFYEGRLKNGCSEEDRCALLTGPTGPWPPLLVWDTQFHGQERRQQDGSYSNDVEADVVCRAIMTFLDKGGVSPGEIGVIVFYKAQARLIRSTLERRMANARDRDVGQREGRAAPLVADEETEDRAGMSASSILVSTVDAFQGGERDVIVLSPCRTESMTSHISSAERLNVALTRGRRHLVVVGCAANLQRDARWKQLLAASRRMPGSYMPVNGFDHALTHARANPAAQARGAVATANGAAGTVHLSSFRGAAAASTAPVDVSSGSSGRTCSRSECEGDAETDADGAADADASMSRWDDEDTMRVSPPTNEAHTGVGKRQSPHGQGIQDGSPTNLDPSDGQEKGAAVLKVQAQGLGEEPWHDKWGAVEGSEDEEDSQVTWGRKLAFAGEEGAPGRPDKSTTGPTAEHGAGVGQRNAMNGASPRSSGHGTPEPPPGAASAADVHKDAHEEDVFDSAIRMPYREPPPPMPQVGGEPPRASHRNVAETRKVLNSCKEYGGEYNSADSDGDLWGEGAGWAEERAEGPTGVVSGADMSGAIMPSDAARLGEPGPSSGGVRSSGVANGDVEQQAVQAGPKASAGDSITVSSEDMEVEPRASDADTPCSAKVAARARPLYITPASAMGPRQRQVLKKQQRASLFCESYSDRHVRACTPEIKALFDQVGLTPEDYWTAHKAFIRGTCYTDDEAQQRESFLGSKLGRVVRSAHLDGSVVKWDRNFSQLVHECRGMALEYLADKFGRHCTRLRWLIHTFEADLAAFQSTGYGWHFLQEAEEEDQLASTTKGAASMGSSDVLAPPTWKHGTVRETDTAAQGARHTAAPQISPPRSASHDADGAGIPMGATGEASCPHLVSSDDSPPPSASQLHTSYRQRPKDELFGDDDDLDQPPGRTPEGSFAYADNWTHAPQWGSNRGTDDWSPAPFAPHQSTTIDSRMERLGKALPFRTMGQWREDDFHDASRTAGSEQTVLSPRDVVKRSSELGLPKNVRSHSGSSGLYVHERNYAELPGGYSQAPWDDDIMEHYPSP